MVFAWGPEDDRLVNGEECKKGDVDYIFVSANVVEKERQADFLVLPGRELSRFQFLEALVRLALRRYMMGQHEHTVTLCVNAVETLFQQTQMGKEIAKTRRDVHAELFTEACSKVYDQYEHVLREVFEHYRALGAKAIDPDKKDGRLEEAVTFNAWQTFLQDAEAMDSEFTSRHAGSSFALGREICADETSGYRHMELSWSEFLVALAAVVYLRNTDNLDEPFDDLLDEFFEEHMEELLRSLTQRSSSGKGGTALSPLESLVAAVVHEADESHSGKVSLRDLKRCFQMPRFKEELDKNKVTVSEINVLFADMERNLLEEYGSVKEVRASTVLEALMQQKGSLRSVERAIVAINNAFEEYDDDNSGSLDFLEFQALTQEPRFVRKMGNFGLSTEELANLFQIFEDDGVDAITMEQVVEGFLSLHDARYKTRNGLKLLRLLFDQADVDQTGGLGPDQVLETFGAPEVIEKLKRFRLQVPDWEHLFEELDTDGSGDLSWDEIQDGMRGFWESNGDD
jgi:Ca2+-binding EF-hand superfamily protein